MKLNKLQQLAVGVALIAIALLLAHYVLLKDKHQNIINTKANCEKLEKDIRLAKAIQQTATELQEEMNHLTAQLDRLKKILPTSIPKPRFMADIKRYANENGVEITELSQNKPVVDDVIVEHPFTYRARGQYHDFGKFFAHLSDYPRIINIKGLHLSRAGFGDYTVQGSFLVSVFTYKEPTEEELKKQVEEKRKSKKGKKGKKGKKN